MGKTWYVVEAFGIAPRCLYVPLAYYRFVRDSTDIVSGFSRLRILDIVQTSQPKMFRNAGSQRPPRYASPQ